MPDLAKIYVDYNDIKGGKQTAALMENASEAVSVGETVLSLDEEGNQCVATVVRLDGDVVILRMDWSTWEPSRETDGKNR
jgi:pectate lyase